MAKRKGSTAPITQARGSKSVSTSMTASATTSATTSDSASERKLLHRARTDTLLKQALTHPITVVVAGTGYGKSTAVYSHLRINEARAIWVQLSEKDNMPSHFWETVSQAVMPLNPRLAAELFAVGFPNTEELRQHLVGLTVNEIGTRYSYVLVFDDLHLITSEIVLDHIAWVTCTAKEILRVIAISKHDVLPGALELQQAERLSRIGEAELSFTKRELAEYFELMDLPISSELLTEIFNETEGWPFAVSFAARLLENHPDNHDRAHIRTALKGNFSAIIDSELFAVLSKELRHFLVRFSLVKHLSPELVREFSDGPAAMEELAARSSLIRYDHYMHVYRFHHLLQQYLEDKQGLLTEGERFETYEKAARWCGENGYRLDALTYYHALGDYDAIIRVTYSFSMVLPIDVATELLDIVEQAPPGILGISPPMTVLHIRLLMTVGRVAESIEQCDEYIASFEARPLDTYVSRALRGLHNIAGFCKLLTCADTHDFSFFEDFEKARGYFESMSEFQPGGFMVFSSGPYALRIGNFNEGVPEHYIEAISRTVPCVATTIKGCMRGIDELTRAEYAFYRGESTQARRLALQSIGAARESEQYETEARALFLLIRIYLQAGKFDHITEALAQLETLTNEATFGNQFVLYELITSWFYAMIGEFGHVEPWLKSDMWSSFEHAIFDGINDTVKAKYYYTSKNYETLLTFINSRSERFGILRYALGKVELGAIKAACLMQLGNRTEALVALKATYDLARPSGIDMPFIELGSPMRSLARLALKESASETNVWDAVAEARGALTATKQKLGIPVEWLTMIQSKAATYAKRLSYVRSRYQDAHNPEASIPLTTKELDILDDLSQGLSRTEISVAHGVSINTIKTMLPLIYQKLGADNALDAIRRATARKLL